MTNHEHEAQIALTLAHRTYRYTLFHLIFGAEPNTEIISKMFSSETQASFADIEPLISYIKENSDKANDPSFIEGIEASYRALFYAMGEQSVCAWESPYLDENGMLFQESTLDVRKYYHEAGLKLQAEKQFPDDHIAAIMDYLAHQSALTYERFADGLDADVLELSKIQRSFIEKHLLTWVSKFAEQVTANDSHGIYAVYANALVQSINNDYQILEEAIKQLEH